jgi:D-alanine-D-alanine ligase
MDKAVAKLVFAARGLPMVPYLVVLRQQWLTHPQEVEAEIASSLGLPLFVKPANLGSSIGISKVHIPAEIGAAMRLAADYDRKIVVEAAVPNAREIECAVLGNDAPEASVPGEIIPSREFYDYQAKYLDEDSRTVVPAELTDAQTAEVKRLAIEVFRAVDGAGMARVDFLMDGTSKSGQLYVTEINTIPGFTTISMFSKMWEASGLAYPALLDKLIALAQERHAEKQQLKTSIT